MHTPLPLSIDNFPAYVPLLGIEHAVESAVTPNVICPAVEPPLADIIRWSP